jgi:hypothetical protein
LLSRLLLPLHQRPLRQTQQLLARQPPRVQPLFPALQRARQAQKQPSSQPFWELRQLWPPPAVVFLQLPWVPRPLLLQQ